MNDKKFLTPNHQIISKNGKTQIFVLPLALSISAQIDEHKAFFVDEIFKKTKIQNGRPIMSHSDARGDSSISH